MFNENGLRIKESSKMNLMRFHDLLLKPQKVPVFGKEHTGENLISEYLIFHVEFVSKQVHLPKNGLEADMVIQLHT